MPRRVSLRERLTPPLPPQGREAIYSGEPTLAEGAPPDRRSPRPSTAGESERWDDAHKRVTFYCPRSLLDVLEAEITSSGHTKTRVITDALRRHLLQPRRRSSRQRPGG